MQDKLIEISKVIDKLAKEDHGLAASLLGDIAQFFDGEITDTKWIEKKAIALSLGKKVTEV
ncbi:hypothetical protein TW85_00160 [Marinomonas sp. S3726]|uniref:hypothetical protein n=1 Tax=Marinomonas sp. S3726 TaxID=579484 RepID=UPI0005FA3C96|nr:hypothetical protein [Marinomonas sp. S3726]KJZ16505.1 hypothetical protein TW85_00160 [Marinomonas sp. S3726]